jgi:ribosomal protein L24E
VLGPRYKLSLCHTPIKPDLLGFPGIGVYAYVLRDHVITRFASNKMNDANTEKLKGTLRT